MTPRTSRTARRNVQWKNEKRVQLRRLEGPSQRDRLSGSGSNLPSSRLTSSSRRRVAVNSPFGRDDPRALRTHATVIVDEILRSGRQARRSLGCRSARRTPPPHPPPPPTTPTPHPPPHPPPTPPPPPIGTQRAEPCTADCRSATVRPSEDVADFERKGTYTSSTAVIVESWTSRRGHQGALGAVARREGDEMSND